MQNATVNPIPEGYHTLTPILVTVQAQSVIDFLKNAFDAQVRSIHHLPDGAVMHAELQIGNSMLMMSDASEKYPAIKTMLSVYVPNVDEVYKNALAAGGTSLREPTNEFYGDRSCGILDLAGNQWWIATHVEDVSPEEMKKREEEYAKQQPKN